MPSSYVIGEHFEAFIREQVEQGRYASASEVVRDGLRVLEDRTKQRALQLEALRAEIRRGTSSGPGIPARKAFADVRKLISATAKAQKSPRR